MKKKILIVYTGGTIGMTRSENGYVPQLDSFIEQLHTIHELKNEKMPKWDFYAMDPLLDSSNISVDEWNKIGEIVAKHYANYDGFVILHGNRYNGLYSFCTIFYVRKFKQTRCVYRLANSLMRNS